MGVPRKRSAWAAILMEPPCLKAKRGKGARSRAHERRPSSGNDPSPTKQAPPSLRSSFFGNKVAPAEERYKLESLPSDPALIAGLAVQKPWRSGVKRRRESSQLLWLALMV